VTRFAEARFRASIMTSSSMRWSFTGGHVGWMMKTSTPRTLSRISTLISPSLNLFTSADPRGMQRYAQISFASSGLAFPVKIFSRVTQFPC